MTLIVNVGQAPALSFTHKYPENERTIETAASAVRLMAEETIDQPQGASPRLYQLLRKLVCKRQAPA